MGGFAWVTLATNDSYSLGALVLAHSLRRVGTKHDLAVLITPGVTQVMRDKLAAVFSLVQEVNVLDSKEEANLALLARPELGITFTKLHCWRLTQYEKCVFVDADALVLRNCDELFEREELSAAPDVGWPDCFNSGVFVFTPSQQTFASITAFAAEKGSFDGGDQGLLNSYFSDWAHKDIAKHLPFIYNMCSTATYSYLPAYKQFGENARIIHFIGATKPWLQYFDTETGVVHPPSGCNHLQPLLQIWWNIFCDNVHSQLSPVMARSTLAPIWHRFTPPSSSSPYNSFPVSSYPIYNDSSHNYDIQRSDKFRNDFDYYEQDHNEFGDYNNRPADFSEFNDPWESYIPKSTPMENTVVYQHEYSPGIQYSNHVQQYYHEVEHQSNYQYQVPSLNHNIQDHQRSEQYDDVHENQLHSKSDDFSNQNYQSPAINHNTDYHRSQESIRDHEYQIHHQSEDSHQSYKTPEESTQISFQYRSNESNNNNHNINEYSKTEENHRLHGSYEAFGVSQEGKETEYFENSNLEAINDRLHNDFISKDSLLSRNYEQIENSGNETHSFSQSLSHQPCTDPLHNLVQHNEQSVENQGQLDTAEDAGIAGALAKMTLGEPRSVEQTALEEHMRRQGWEQGQIDYMGRDSFENIWKKICDTLNEAPRREPSPPKEQKNSETKSSPIPESTSTVEQSPKAAIDTEEVEADSSRLSEAPAAAVAIAAEIIEEKNIQSSTTEIIDKSTVQDEPEIKTEDKLESAAIITQSKEEKEKKEAIKEVEIKDNEGEITLKEIDSIPKEITAPPPNTEEQSKEDVSMILDTEVVDNKITEDVSSMPIPEADSSSNANAENFISTLEVTPASASLAEQIDEGIKPVSESSEFILDSGSVPIQVAESVLQSEPKESVSEDQSPVSEEALSSVVSPLLESVTAVSETVAEPSQDLIENGDSKDIENGIDSPPKSQPEPEVKEAAPVPEDKTQPEVKATAPVLEDQTEPEVKATAPVLEDKTEPEVKEAASVPENKTEPEVKEAASVPEDKTEPEVKEVASVPEDKTEPVEVPVEPTDEISSSRSSESASLTPPDSPITESPVRPARTKDQKVPTTPTVTEATPPNSPPIGAQQSLDDQPKTVKKVVKKIVKKLPAESEGGDGVEGGESGTGKKIVKKIVKKVVKKPKEDAENGAEAPGTAAGEKPKKVVKIVKKIIKPADSLEVDTSVPETPPAGVPVPPKRKTKTTTTKVTTTTTTTAKNIPAEDKPSQSEP